MSKKTLILSFCFLSLPVNFIYSHTYEGIKFGIYEKIMSASTPCIIGACFLLLGNKYSELGINRQNDIPTTPSQRDFYVIRNYLPKEDLDRIKEYDQKLALEELRWSKIFYALGALCIVGGIGEIFYEDIGNIFKRITQTI